MGVFSNPKPRHQSSQRSGASLQTRASLPPRQNGGQRPPGGNGRQQPTGRNGAQPPSGEDRVQPPSGEDGAQPPSGQEKEFLYKPRNGGRIETSNEEPRMCEMSLIVSRGPGPAFWSIRILLPAATTGIKILLTEGPGGRLEPGIADFVEGDLGSSDKTIYLGSLDVTKLIQVKTTAQGLRLDDPRPNLPLPPEYKNVKSQFWVRTFIVKLVAQGLLDPGVNRIIRDAPRN